jgi:hypothetical protein
MEKKEPLFNIRYTIAKKDIPDFVNSLHVLQEHYMEAAMEQKAREGFPEATDAIRYIMDLK